VIPDLNDVRMFEISKCFHVATKSFCLYLGKMRVPVESFDGDKFIGRMGSPSTNGRHSTCFVNALHNVMAIMATQNLKSFLRHRDSPLTWIDSKSIHSSRLEAVYQAHD
jgi:hypothetical protein